ncbi:MAG TPA: alpha/beta hydrolase [Devosia sp.]|jgi:pimeloyl-ACP methyl ester carboxylesterase|uniref:alpha/beta fold hydrolase n=1 Tax=Devosia sp. TaxID=1871048 RepID=UPI002DDCECCB|nr:alpha/beta hydrolase [Devosia sp.]HEV2518299.1 alpha/beta hydrolase [Devosia sp.]
MKSVLSALVFGAAAVGAGSAALAAEPAKNVVLVHGAFADETSWDKVAQILSAKGYHVTQVANPLTSLADDVAATRAALDAQDGPTVLVGHSWGGVVIGEAGADPKVKALVYVSAFAPDQGETLTKLLAGGEPSEGVKAIRPNAEGGLILDPLQFPKLFAGDVPVAEAEAMAAQQLPSNPANFEAVAEVAAWHDKPNFYVVTTEDLMLPADAQRFFAGRLKAEATEIVASHSGLISKAEDVAKVIEAAAQ